MRLLKHESRGSGEPSKDPGDSDYKNEGLQGFNKKPGITKIRCHSPALFRGSGNLKFCLQPFFAGSEIALQQNPRLAMTILYS
jgi:hypothetical protein